MIPFDILLTALIVAAAAAWAGRGIWRLLRRRVNGRSTRACGGPAGGCENCTAGEPEPTLQDTGSCGDDRPRES